MATPRFSLTTSYKPRTGDCLVLPFASRRTPRFDPKCLPKALRDLKPGKDKGATVTAFTGKVGRAQIRVRVVRLDAEHSSDVIEARKMIPAAIDEKDPPKRIVAFVSADNPELLHAAHEGAWLGGYRFDKYLTKKQAPPAVLLVTDGQPAKLRATLKRAETVFGYVNVARDVLNEPANEIHPPALANAFRRAGREAGLRVSVWDDKRLKRERCGGVLAVGGGAAHKPRLVIGTYGPRKAKRHLCLVGKGVTFDTGGYCVKPSASQKGMKYDMGGAAMTFAAACSIAALKLPIRLTVITPLVENDISATAFHTTDVIRTRSGRTVEVGNTDAEGRLILADGLSLAVEREPDWIVDAATLTGACVVALGEDIAGLYGTDADLAQQFVRAGAAVGERFWELPLHMPYGEQLTSLIADTSNMGGKWNGSITAAVFLKQWVPDKVKWLHCDIAGPGIKEDPLDHLGKGAKGFGVKTLVRLAEELC